MRVHTLDPEHSGHDLRNILPHPVLHVSCNRLRMPGEPKGAEAGDNNGGRSSMAAATGYLEQLIAIVQDTAEGQNHIERMLGALSDILWPGQPPPNTLSRCPALPTSTQGLLQTGSVHRMGTRPPQMPVMGVNLTTTSSATPFHMTTYVHNGASSLNSTNHGSDCPEAADQPHSLAGLV